jgi:hypothetical protein
VCGGRRSLRGSALTPGPGPSLRAVSAAAEPVARLRGAEVGADRRRVVEAVGALAVAVAAVAAVVSLAVTLHHNRLVQDLRYHGVTVTARVTGCLGSLAGSGSNAAGYTCRASFLLDGRRHDDVLPGTVQRQPGTRLRMVTSPDAPSVLATPRGAATGEASSWLYLVPGGFAAAAAGGAVLLVWRRAGPRPAPGGV